MTVSAEHCITLEQALFIAENSSPTIQKALLKREQSHQNLITRKAILEQPLFTCNSPKMSLKMLELEVENFEIEYALAKLLLEKNVTTLFYNVYMAQLSLDIAREELDNMQQRRNATADKVEAKLTAGIGLYQADLNLSSARSAVKNKEMALENAKASFKEYIGVDLNDEINVLASVTSSDFIFIPMDKTVRYGLELRMEICRNLENYRTQIEIEKQNQLNAELAYEISLEKYKNGDITGMDLNLYQSQLSNRKLSMAQAQIYYKLELLNLKIATRYDFEKTNLLWI